jgi:hypothetical protein
MEFNDAEEHIYSAVRSSNWWWNNHVYQLDFFIATMTLTAAIGTVALWSYDCPFNRQFSPETSYRQFPSQEEVSSIIQSQKHWLNNWSNVFEPCDYRCCPYSRCSDISLTTTWTNIRHDRTMDQSSGGPKEGLQSFCLSSQCAFNMGNLMLWVASRIRKRYSVISAGLTDSVANIHLHLTRMSHCLVFKVPKLSFGEGNSLLSQLRDNQLYFQNIILATLGDKAEIGDAR